MTDRDDRGEDPTIAAERARPLRDRPRPRRRPPNEPPDEAARSSEIRRRFALRVKDPPKPRRSLYGRILALMVAVLATYGALTLLLAWQLGATVLEDVYRHEVAPAQLRTLTDAVLGPLADGADPARLSRAIADRYGADRRPSLAVYGPDGALLADRPGSRGPAPSALPPRERATVTEGGLVRDPDGLGFVAVGPVHRSDGALLGFVRVAARPETVRTRALILSASWRWSFPVFLLSVLAAYLGTRSITERLRQAEDAVLRMAQGDPKARIPVATPDAPDELDRVGLIFNRAVDLLENTVQELERIDNTRRRLVADFAHELNTPLTNVLAYLETLEMAEEDGGMAPDERRGFLSVAHEEARRLAHLARDLETLTKIEAGNLPMDRQLVDLSRLALGLAQRIEPRARQQGLEVRTDIDAGAEIVGDPNRLEQVGMNLLENALRYTKQGHVDVGVRRVQGGAELVIGDSGIGIPKDDIAKVMQRFYRVDPSRTRATGGSGLGLAIVGSIVQRHGGTVRIESEVGAGTRVIVFLPEEGTMADLLAPVVED